MRQGGRRAAECARDVVRITNLVQSENDTEKINFQTLKTISSTIPGSWMVSGHCGMILDQGTAVWVTLSGQEVSGANAKHPGIIPHRVEHSKCSQIEISKMNKIFSESANILLERSYTRLGQNPPRVSRSGLNHPPGHSE